MNISVIISAVVSIIGAIISICFGLITIRTQAYKEVNDRYDQMVKFRVDHPEVFHLARDWSPRFWHKIYDSKHPENVQWVIYYNYVELCLGYINSVLGSRRYLTIAAYEHHHKYLVKLIIAEHNPMIEGLLKDSYISPHIKQFRKKLESDGWDWSLEHRKLVS